jgi:hypothetical protein
MDTNLDQLDSETYTPPEEHARNVAGTNESLQYWQQPSNHSAIHGADIHPTTTESAVVLSTEPLPSFLTNETLQYWQQDTAPGSFYHTIAPAGADRAERSAERGPLQNDFIRFLSDVAVGLQ